MARSRHVTFHITLAKMSRKKSNILDTIPPEEVGRKQRSRADRSISTVKSAESAKFFVSSQQFSQRAVWSIPSHSVAAEYLVELYLS